MRFSLVTVLAAVTISASANILPRQLPACATPCLTGEAVTNSGCGATDNSCLCKSKSFVDTSTACIVNSCSGSDVQTAVSAAQAICKAFGVTLSGTLPSPTATGSSGASKTSGVATTATAPASKSSSATSSAASPSGTSNSAASNTVNALAGIAAIGFAALAL